MRVKVIDIREAKNVGKNLTKQEVIIADKTGNTILTLWESDIDTLKIAESYHVTKLNVRIFCGSYTLSFPKIGASITNIDDIGEVMETQEDPSEPFMDGVSIVGVKDVVTFKTCISCSAKITMSQSVVQENITCTKCNTAQFVAKCSLKVMAKLLLEGPNVSIITLVAYEDMLTNILPPDTELSAETLLKSKPFNVTYNSFHVITSVYR